MRDAFADAVYDAAKTDPRVCVVVADISPAGSMERFRSDFPDRFINVGVAEQAMIGVAAGMALRGMRPFCYTIAPFALFRPLEFIRCDLAYQRLPVVVVGMGAGLSYGALGPTHHATEDVEVACAVPELALVAPCDPPDVRAAVRWCLRQSGPVYVRLGKAGEPDLPNAAAPFEDLRWLRGTRANTRMILTYGPVAARAVSAAYWSVATLRVLKPLDREKLRDIVGRGHVLVLEEASGAPLYRELLAIRNELELPHTPARWDLRSCALPREFVRRVGSREELLKEYLR